MAWRQWAGIMPPMLTAALYLLLAYAVPSFWEAFFHRAVLHASDDARRLWRSLGDFGSLLRLAHFFHNVIHHRQTFTRSLVVQFNDQHHRSRINARLPGAIGRRAQLDNYGLTVTGPFEFLAFTAVPMVINACLAVAMQPRVIWLGLALAITPYLLSRYLHPLLHTAPPATAQGISTRWRRSTLILLLQRHHLSHHRSPTMNFNLMLGADWVLRRASGVSAKPNPFNRPACPPAPSD